MIKNCLIPNKNNKYKPYLLRKVALVIYSLMLVFVNSFGGFLGIDQAQANTITADNIISLTNQERESLGLNTLNSNSQLAAAALAKANDMFEKQYWDHFGPNGETPWQFIRAAGYTYVYAGENLAKGFKTAEGVHEAWMASPTHKANIVSENYKDIGVAVVEGTLFDKQTILVVQMFGNKTTEIYSPADDITQPEETTEPEEMTKPEETTEPTSSKSNDETTTEETKPTTSQEQGEIKSISITSPTNGSVYTDPSLNVTGNVTNVDNGYTVEIYDENEIVGNTTGQSSAWEYSKDSDWTEGKHTIKAGIKGERVYSEESIFSIDSTPPVVNVDSVSVLENENQYTLSFNVVGEWESIDVIAGSEIMPIEKSEDIYLIQVVLDKEDVLGSVIIHLSDSYENTSDLDISNYFEKEEEKETSFISLASLNLGDKISIGIVSVIFILLCIELIVYWKKGLIKNAIGDFFTIGVWWFILSIAILSGFSGNIN